MLEITYPQALAAMRAAVADRGEDYVYPESEKDSHGACQYLTTDGKGLCIVGETLLRLGVSSEEIQQALDGTPYTPGSYGLMSWLYRNKVAFEDERTSVLFATSQARQDFGETWGIALREAEDYVQVTFDRSSKF